MKKNNAIPVTRILNDTEYLSELTKKLEEEVDEFRQSNDVMELVDIYEVILAILDVKNVSFDEFINKREEKVLTRGAFKQKIFLEKEE